MKLFADMDDEEKDALMERFKEYVKKRMPKDAEVVLGMRGMAREGMNDPDVWITYNHSPHVAISLLEDLQASMKRQFVESN